MVPPAESGPCMVKGAPYPVSREVYVGTLLRSLLKSCLLQYRQRETRSCKDETPARRCGTG